MHTEITKPPEATSFERSYPGTADQVREVRADLAAVAKGFPHAEELVLVASELSTNAVVHSRSRQPGGTFTVRAEVHPGQYAWLEVEDQGGDWIGLDPGDPGDPCDEHGRGLGILAFLAGDGNWGIEAGNACDTRVVWARLDWIAPDDL